MTAERRVPEPSLQTLPDELLTKIFNTLPAEHAFRLAQVNTRLFHIFRAFYDTLDLTAPFETNPILTEQQLHTVLRNARNLKLLKTATGLPHLPADVPLHTLACLDTAVGPGFAGIPSLRWLAIDKPLGYTPGLLSSVVPQLSGLEMTNINVASPLLRDVESLLKNHGRNLKHFTLTLGEESIHSITLFTRVLSNLRNFTNLRSLTCGINTPEALSRSPHEPHAHLIKTLVNILSTLTTRPETGSTNVQIFTAFFQPRLLRALLPYAGNSRVHLSFAGNTIVIPHTGRPVITQLASDPCMYKLPLLDGVIHTNLSSFNIVRRELAVGYTDDQVSKLQSLISGNLTKLRVQIPFRSITNLDPIARNIMHVMELSNVQELHITREVVYFLHEQPVTTLSQQWKTLKRLYLTAPERFVQDPYPERHSVKYSAWRFLISLPDFLQSLPELCPRLEILLLEKLCEMGVVQNSNAMMGLIQQALKAVDVFERVLSADAGTVRGQLLVWRKQFL